MLCSQLASLSVDGCSQPAETILIEEIDSFGVLLAADSAYASGIRVTLRADGFKVAGHIVSCVRRENDYAVALDFADGFRWSPEVFRPEHLYAPPSRAKGKGAAGEA